MTKSDTVGKKPVIDDKYQSIEKLAEDVKSTVKEYGPTATKPKHNRIVLAGFMDFNELTSYLSTESNADFTEGIKPIQEEWQVKRQYMNTIHTHDPYVLPPDMVTEIDENVKDYSKELSEKIKYYPPYNELSFSLKMVEIDHMVSLQNHINLDQVNVSCKNIKENMTQRELLDLCVNTGDFELPIKKQMIGFANPSALAGVATFTTENDDIRMRGVEYRDVFVHEKNGKPTTKSKAKALVLMLSRGDPFAIAYRFPANIQNGIQLTQRNLVILNNGFHRAYALKKAGYKHMPCVFSDLTAEQIQTYLSVWQNRLTLCGYQRPPLFKDYFDPSLTMQITAPSRKRFIKVSWNTEILPIFD